MAAIRLIALHKNKGKSVAACLKSRTDYAKNPDKTNRGELVSSYECSPKQKSRPKAAKIKILTVLQAIR